jgi:hypothetical protein
MLELPVAFFWAADLSGSDIDLRGTVADPWDRPGVLAAIACDMRYLEVPGLISPAIAKRNAMIDLPFVGEERLAAEGTNSTL